MATRKKSDRNVWEEIKETQRKFDENHPVLATRYWVYEYKESTEDEYGCYVTARSSYPMSDYYDTYEEAEAWMEEYEPTPGWVFKIGVENLRSFTEQRWGV